MARVWINPAFQKKEENKEEIQKKSFKSQEEENVKKSSALPVHQAQSREFFQKLIDMKNYLTITFYDGSILRGKLKWFDTQSICMEQEGKEIVFDSKNIMFYRS
ncbi:MAG TPA: hypothetical protein PL110_19190 [Candidatus Eremiobacteraeota bacterium]|nr:MAG: hypothetical protein BWY64_03789 [bacterium ADurb.Bin363]HPZ10224.1 hypothetical protein [Candidatus Eremiobacteraeota bacterium]